MREPLTGGRGQEGSSPWSPSTPLLLSQGVTIEGLCTFTISKPALGNPSPVFILSEKFASHHNIRIRKAVVEGTTPVTSLNFAKIANLTPFGRSTVEDVVSEIILVRLLFSVLCHFFAIL